MATCAGDTQVRVHDFEKKATIYVFNCHSRRVKRLESIHTEPFVFWSASEDGTIRQFDIRCPQHVRLFTYLCSNNNFKQSSSVTSPNVLIDLTRHIGGEAEAKCLAVNPVRPSMLAVGANDGYIRVFDRRILSLTSACPVFAQTAE